MGIFGCFPRPAPFFLIIGPCGGQALLHGLALIILLAVVCFYSFSASAVSLYPRCPMKKFYLNPRFLLSGRPSTQFAGIAEADPRNRRRSERVLVQIPVLFEIPQPGGRTLHGDAYTLCVNAHGGLMELGVHLERGQKFAVSNPGTADRRACHVVRCDRSRNGYFAVSFEFETPAGDFWPILSVPVDWKSYKD
jgi:hypothetical protein